MGWADFTAVTIFYMGEDEIAEAPSFEVPREEGVPNTKAQAPERPASDVFRSVYRELSDEEKEFVEHVKVHAGTLYAQIVSAEKVADPRMSALAKTKLEEAVMWSVKAITR